ncbi:hypothetical protein B0H17DRAFT_940535 [Mycena rosella]|uniref:GATA-type domain-containing protein n=1 Tax=Mycena rosella TaxID=1033263 RepID=A0AAD7D9N4_MYCRO|nr:hypothetical protein B0H17DRAFT_940535 [Mycena rosella]
MAPPQNGQQQQGGVVQVVHTDDAATKLSDRVRRRCFNCCTTDTSTWRRSNLSPGKVLCNKCGLFERTHSRPRPEQFPHKRGPLASSTLRSRSPPGGQQQVSVRFVLAISFLGVAYPFPHFASFSLPPFPSPYTLQDVVPLTPLRRLPLCLGAVVRRPAPAALCVHLPRSSRVLVYTTSPPLVLHRWTPY